MPRINVLPKNIAELIAAGEVVERPSSVVKELTENSIDAGASAITIEIQNGGISLIRITDNGCGIYHSDVPNAFVSHATSKITVAGDLDSIATLGFRGEALASVCAVSKVRLLTKSPEEEIGTVYSIEGGVQQEYEEAGCPNGTTIIVSDIFYNVPARMKFLKKAVTEGNAIADIVDKLALSHPEISFKFIRDGKQIILTPGDSNLLGAVYAVFGQDFAKTLVSASNSINGISVSGLVSKPSDSRATRAMQFFFVNGRYVRSRALTSAFENAYKNSVMVGKFPACVLNIEVPCDTVDVNVHPTKTEVRFSDERRVNAALYYTVKSCVDSLDVRPSFDFRDVTEPAVIPAAQLYVHEVVPPEKVEPIIKPQDSFWQRIRQIEPDRQQKVSDIGSDISYQKADEPNLTDVTPSVLAAHEPQIVVSEAEEETDDFRYIGEAFETYLMVEFEGKLCLIDKHAAHERIIFNQLKKQANLTASQTLIEPIVLTVSKLEYNTIIDNRDVFENSGFVVEDFGDGSIIIRCYPMLLDEDDASCVVLEIADGIIKGKVDLTADRVDDILHTTACKAAIKAGNKNSSTELEKLAYTVCHSADVRYCPHGRPVMIEMTRYELEKQFKRIQN